MFHLIFLVTLLRVVNGSASVLVDELPMSESPLLRGYAILLLRFTLLSSARDNANIGRPSRSYLRGYSCPPFFLLWEIELQFFLE